VWNLVCHIKGRLRVFENRVQRRILGAMRDGVTGELRKLHEEEIYNFYSSSNIIKQNT
jgi:hypothetical protein